MGMTVRTSVAGTSSMTCASSMTLRAASSGFSRCRSRPCWGGETSTSCCSTIWMPSEVRPSGAWGLGGPFGSTGIRVDDNPRAHQRDGPLMRRRSKWGMPTGCRWIPPRARREHESSSFAPPTPTRGRPMASRGPCQSSCSWAIGTGQSAMKRPRGLRSARARHHHPRQPGHQCFRGHPAGCWRAALLTASGAVAYATRRARLSSRPRCPAHARRPSRSGAWPRLPTQPRALSPRARKRLGLRQDPQQGNEWRRLGRGAISVGEVHDALDSLSGEDGSSKIGRRSVPPRPITSSSAPAHG
jgi:hypothetical protein